MHSTILVKPVPSSIPADEHSPEAAVAAQAAATAGHVSEGDENYTHIHIILDRSGSMEALRDDTIGGVNAFLDSQRAADVKGDCTVTLAQFDGQEPYVELYANADVRNVQKLTRATFIPRGDTPLYDAICRGLGSCESLIRGGARKPGKVVVAIVTDGQENSSREHNQAAAKKSIAKYTAMGWQFLYIGVGIDAMTAGASVGVCAASTLSVDATTRGVHGLYATMTCATKAYRNGDGAKGIDLGAAQAQVNNTP